MPRSWQETIQPWPELSSNQLYRCAVAEVSKQSEPHGIQVVLRHLDEPQPGRMHNVVLSLPIRPSGLTCEFFSACGLTTATGEKLSPLKSIGSIIGVRFIPAENGEWSPIHFERANAKENHDA